MDIIKWIKIREGEKKEGEEEIIFGQIVNPLTISNWADI